MNPTMHTLTGFCAAAAGLFAFIQVVTTSTPQLGWIARPWMVRAPMGLAGIAMICRGVTSLAKHQEFNPLGAFVVWALTIMFAAELMVILTASFRGQAAAAADVSAAAERAAELVAARIKARAGHPPQERALRELFLKRLRRQGQQVDRNTQGLEELKASQERMHAETAWLREGPAVWGGVIPKTPDPNAPPD